MTGGARNDTTHVFLRERILLPKDLRACHSGIYFSSFLHFPFVVPMIFLVIPAILLVIPAILLVIPAKAGIQGFTISSNENGNPEY